MEMLFSSIDDDDDDGGGAADIIRLGALLMVIVCGSLRLSV